MKTTCPIHTNTLLLKYCINALFNKFSIWLRYILSPTSRQVDPVFIEGGNESVCSCHLHPRGRRKKIGILEGFFVSTGIIEELPYSRGKPGVSTNLA